MQINHSEFILSLLMVVASYIDTEAQSSKRQPHNSIQTADSLFALKDWRKAKTVYESVLRESIPNSLAWNRLGFCNYKLGNHDVAIACYQKSLQLKPDVRLKAVVFSRMARIHALKSENQKAWIDLDSAINAGYGNLAELDTLNDFTNLRNDQHFKDIRQRVYATAFPCMVDPQVREFDFWVGNWDVYQSGTTVLVGHNTIEIIADGCGLLESWTNMGNQTGKSLNFIDVNNQWKQTWVGGGNQEFVEGVYTDGAMRFVFETTDAHGNKQIGRFIFFNEGPNRVRQFNETSSDGGNTWVTAYDFTYIRKK